MTKPISTTTNQAADKMTKVKCHLCNFEWNYKGERTMATCPNCSRKTLAKKEGEQ